MCTLFKQACRLMTNSTSVILLFICASITPFPTAALAAQQIEIFDAKSWQSFEKNLERPAIVVFSTTDCSHCPAVIRALSEQLKARDTVSKTAKTQADQVLLNPVKPALIVVVMDGMADMDLLNEAHYATADRLFIFSESDAPANSIAALQYSINPKWRGITPYVALLGKGEATKFIMGKPSSAEIDALTLK